MPGSNNWRQSQKPTEITAVTRVYAFVGFPTGSESLQNPTEITLAFYILWEPFREIILAA
jgi:hypothetical protein